MVVAPPKMSSIGLVRFNGAETNCGIAHILRILLIVNCCFDIYFDERFVAIILYNSNIICF